MTVDELLAALRAAFRLFDENAVEAWGPVFRAKFAKHEGEQLREAYFATLGSFKAGKQVFPLPADFEAHVPSFAARLEQATRRPLDLAAQRARKQALVDQWQARQGSGTERMRGRVIAAACRWEAERIAGRLAWCEGAQAVALNADQITLCEERAVSSCRNLVYGPRSMRRADPSQWEEQRARIRDVLHRNEPLPLPDDGKPTGPSPAAVRMRETIDALVEARRRGDLPPPPRQQQPAEPSASEMDWLVG